MDEKKLGQRLQAARQAAGLTQQALCQKAGLSYSTLAKIERGAIRTPSIFTIQSIAVALGTTLDELVGTVFPALPIKQRLHSQSGVSFVYFDVNNCLVRFIQRAFTQVAIDCDLPADIIETAFWRYNSQACRGEITLAEFNREVGRLLHLPQFDWRRYYLAAVQPTPHMRELVEWTRKQYGIGLLTNSMPGMVKSLIERGLVPDIPYDAIIDSSEVHLLKPEREIYELAQSRADCAPEEILFIDDSRANIMAAEKLGWHVMVFDDIRPKEGAGHIQAALEPAT